MTENRQTKRLIIIGTNGTGKTTFSRKLAETEINNGGKVLILTPDFSEWTDVDEVFDIKKINNIGKIIYEPGFDRKGIHTPGTIERVWNEFHDGLLIADDFKAFGIDTNSNEGDFLRKLWIRSRQKMIDLAFAAHGFDQVVPTFIFAHCSDIVLYRTTDSITSNKIKDIDKMKQKQAEINKKAESDAHYHLIIKQ